MGKEGGGTTPAYDFRVLLIFLGRRGGRQPEEESGWGEGGGGSRLGDSVISFDPVSGILRRCFRVIAALFDAVLVPLGGKYLLPISPATAGFTFARGASLLPS